METLAADANYVGFGVILSTSNEADAEEAKGLSVPAQMCQVAACPVIGIDGITAERGQILCSVGHGAGARYHLSHMYSDRPNGDYSLIDDSD